MNLSKYKVNVPEGQSGVYKIECFEIDKEGQAREAFHQTIKGYRRDVVVGTYTRLVNTKCFDGLIMSDTPAEISDHIEAIEKAKGRILINGLGIGMVLNGCLMKPEVEHATVIEISEDVIKLVAPHYKAMYGDRLDIIHADALEYQSPRGSRYGMVWHDIWPNICADNLNDIKVLKKKYARRSEWQGCWVEHLVRDAARRF